MSNNSCNIIRDLLPLYIEGLTSEESNKFIEEHVKECKDCSKLLEEMKEDTIADSKHDSTNVEKNDVITFNFLKKSQKIIKAGMICSIIGVLALVTCIFLARVYFDSRTVTGSMIEINELSVADGNVIVEGKLLDESLGVKTIDYHMDDEDGVLKIDVKSSLKTPFNKSNFSVNYCDTKVKTIVVCDRVIWDCGVEIPNEVATVYGAKHPYIGDMSKNIKSSNALGISANLGTFKNELQTSNEPYGWTIILEEDISGRNEEHLNEWMEYYGAMLIATIDNLDFVCFEYQMNGQDKNFSISEKEADAIYGSSVKNAAKTPLGLYELMKVR